MRSRSNSPPLDSTITTAPETSDFASQLHLARQKLASRVHIQQREDGIEVEGVQDAQDDGAAPAEHNTSAHRRGSFGGSSASGDEEEENGHVEKMLLGRGAPAEEPIKEENDEATEGGAPEPTAPAAEQPVEDDRVCRICFGGEDPELGKLFAPCHCRGTARHVHVACLDQWRRVSARSGASFHSVHSALMLRLLTRSVFVESFYKCEQCGFAYRLSRTGAAKVLTSSGAFHPPVLRCTRTSLTSVTNNAAATLLLVTCIAFTFLTYIAGFLATKIIETAELASRHRLQTQSGSFHLSEFFVSDHVILGEGLREVVDVIGKRVETASWASAPVDQKALEADKDLEDGVRGWFDFLKPSVTDSKTGRQKKKNGKAVRRRDKLIGLVMHFTKGLSLVGILSVFQTYIATALFSPLGHGIFRALRPNRRQQGSRNENANLSQIVIIIVSLVLLPSASARFQRAVVLATRRVLKPSKLTLLLSQFVIIGTVKVRIGPSHSSVTASSC